MNIKIVSGGQTGVDQGALEAAVQQGLEFGARAQRGRSARVQVARNTGEDEGVSFRGAMGVVLENFMRPLDELVKGGKIRI